MLDITDDIIKEAASGDMQAFEKIYRSFSGLVYSLALRVLKQPQEAEELTQDVFVKIFHQLKSFQFQSSLKTWIYRIAVNTALNQAKKISRERKNANVYQKDIESETRIQKPEIKDTESQEKMVNLLLSHLNEDQRTCVILRNIEGLSYQEIADTLKIKINTVRTRLKRAREKLLSVKKEVSHHEI